LYSEGTAGSFCSSCYKKGASYNAENMISDLSYSIPALEDILQES
jgi:hypothetical protein